MSVLKNRIPTWHKCFRNSCSQQKNFTAKSSSVSSVPACGLFPHLKSKCGQIILLCSAPSQSCLRPELNKQFRCFPSLFGRPFSLSSHQAMASSPLNEGTDNQGKEKLLSQMNMRLVNENNFLSWCRNAYLSSVVGVAMITEGTTVLAQSAGAGALIVGAMNVLWGTSNHIINLIRLRHVSGMSGFALALNMLGSSLHCLLWIFVLVCYVGFLDETGAFEQHHKAESSAILPNMEFQHYDTTVKMKKKEV